MTKIKVEDMSVFEALLALSLCGNLWFVNGISLSSVMVHRLRLSYHKVILVACKIKIPPSIIKTYVGK